MFEHPTTEEAQTGVIKISDNSVDAVRGLLEFIYSGEVENLDEKAEDMLMIAEKYNLPTLKMMCEENISLNLTSNNVCQILVLAELHLADKLKTACLDFICENSQHVLKSNNWLDLEDSDPKLVIRIMKHVISECIW